MKLIITRLGDEERASKVIIRKREHQHLHNELRRPLLDASIAYSKAWHRSFAPYLLRLPRELRDMIYSNVWTEDYVTSDYCDSMAYILHWYADRVKRPHVIDIDYVGPEIAREMVEAYYLHARRVYNVQSVSPAAIKYFITHGAFQVGLNPAYHHRAITVSLCLGYHSNDESPSSLSRRLNHLHQIVKKNGFSLKFQIYQRRVRLNSLDNYLAAIRPIFHTFEAAGADAHVSWFYDCEDDTRVAMDLTDYVRTPKSRSDWKAKVISLLSEQAHKILERHREYLREDDDDYDPDGYCSPGEEDSYDDSWEW